MNKLSALILLLLFFFSLLSSSTAAKILHSEKSMYRNILVSEDRGERCMVFGRLSRNPTRQSCFLIKSPETLVFSYAQFIMAGFTQVKQPVQRILIIGLGGGTLPMTLEKLYPDARIDSVEIDPAVVSVAKDWFDYRESEKQTVTIIDGRVFVKRQILKKVRYDVIILDAFNGDYIPEHMMTREYFEELKQILAPDGLLMANTFSTNRLYHHESVTYQHVFGPYYHLHSDRSGNRIIYANLQALDSYNSHSSNQALRIKLERIGVNFDRFNRLINQQIDWDQNARPLTDQYSPANLLKY